MLVDKQNRAYVACAACVLIVSQGTLANEEYQVDAISGESVSLPLSECGIWLAPSTIPGAGLGMYAGKDFKSNENLQALGDVTIPIVDMPHHQNGDWKFLWDEYTWNAVSLGMIHEGLIDVNVASPGFGSAANSFLPLVNVEEWNPEYGACGLHRSRDPGAGAFSTYHNRISTAKRDITAGEELFVDYGSNWFTSRAHLGPIPLYKDLDRATHLFQQFKNLKTKLQSPTLNTILSEVWNEFVSYSNYTDSRVIGAFHHHDETELRRLENQTLTEIRLQDSSRSREWLALHGTCGDHIVAGVSTIRQAGRGAFATRDLPVGTVVSHIPLIHVPDRKRFEMYNLGVEDGEKYPDKALGISGYQLLLNYCYGHANSTLLLCPYGPMVNLVNHNKTLANVALRWADPRRGNHMPALLKGSIEELEKDSTAKLAMELVATHDIQEGAEVFMDYGDDWEKAWHHHIKDWEAPLGSHAYMSADDMNGDKEMHLRTEFELLDKPYPPNLELKCNEAFVDSSWENAWNAGTLRTFLESRKEDSFHPCEILRSEWENGKLLYTAVLHQKGVTDNASDRNELLEHVPQDAFQFRDKHYTTDMHQKNAFRHDIRIPDTMLPSVWMNRKE